LPVHWHRLL